VSKLQAVRRLGFECVHVFRAIRRGVSRIRFVVNRWGVLWACRRCSA
jgi:hypothetical protein